MSEPITLILAGFSIGLLSSFHCVGMCGPLAISLPFSAYSGISRITTILFYNTGRAMTYSLLGLFIGLAGQGFYFLGLQQLISITAGLFILLMLFGKHLFQFRNSKLDGSLYTFFAKYLRPGNIGSFFFTGMVNGLLPCGMVYVALASAAAASKVWGSGLLMFSFGLGTFPLMISTIALGKFITHTLRSRIYQAVPWFVGFVAVMLIVRGLGLNIPYLSPVLSIDRSAISCHPIK